VLSGGSLPFCGRWDRDGEGLPALIFGLAPSNLSSRPEASMKMVDVYLNIDFVQGGVWKRNVKEEW
jgi:hypothetical protein